MVMNGNRSVPNFNAPLVDAALEKVSIKQKKEIDKEASQDAAAALEKVSVEQKEENDKEEAGAKRKVGTAIRLGFPSIALS